MIQITPPSYPIKGRISISGSKSISNRYLILSEVLGESIELKNLATAEDTRLLKQALEVIHQASHIDDVDKICLIDIGHAGTDMRFLTSLLAIKKGRWTLTGSDRMKQRPIKELVEALQQLGADITYLEKEGYPPLRINGKTLTGGEVEIRANVSSQFISSLLLISCALKEGIRLRLIEDSVSEPYVNMTMALLREANIPCTVQDRVIDVKPSISSGWKSASVTIESDWSSASYWYSFCALNKHASLALSYFNPESLQADARLPEIYSQLGVHTEFEEGTVKLSCRSEPVKTFHYNFTDCPDLAQTVAVTCFGLGIEASLSGLSTLKIKETDRIEALKTELEKLGAKVDCGPDFIDLQGASHVSGQNSSVVMTYNDHRMAMSFAPLCLVMGSVRIDDPEVVRKSYPAFWEDLKSLGFSVNLQP